MKEIKYTIKPVIHCKYRNLSAKFTASLNLTDGPKSLSPTATQWELLVEISTDRQTPPFDLIENIFRSFLDSEFSVNTSKLRYEQRKHGFNVLFVPEHLYGLGVGARREVRSIHINVEIVYQNLLPNRKVFPEILRALNYGFTTIMNKVVRIAPLVFDVSKCIQLKTTLPFLKPISNSLNIGGQDVLERVLENGIIGLRASPLNATSAKSNSAHKNPKSTKSGAEKFKWVYFANISYQDHKYMVMASDSNCEHEPCFLDELDTIDNAPIDPVLR